MQGSDGFYVTGKGKRLMESWRLEFNASEQKYYQLVEIVSQGKCYHNFVRGDMFLVHEAKCEFSVSRTNTADAKS